jgi:hypothetical protein
LSGELLQEKFTLICNNSPLNEEVRVLGPIYWSTYLRLIRRFLSPVVSELDWSFIGQGAVGSVVVVILAVFFEHEFDLPHGVKDLSREHFVTKS